jgi:hypothetical protein
MTVLTKGTTSFASQGEFIQRVSAALAAFKGKDGALPVSSQEILLSQAAYETEWGRTVAATVNNVFNLTTGPSWHGDTLLGPDTEYAKDGSGEPRRIVQPWRAYSSLDDGIRDMVDNWLLWPRYKPGRVELLAGNLGQYLKKIRDDDPTTRQVEGGYYTQKLELYVRGVWRTMQIIRAMTGTL